MAKTLYGRLTLVTGPETFLAERTAARLITQAQAENPNAGLRRASGPDLVPAMIDEMAGTDLFSSASIAYIAEAEKLPSAVEARLLELAKAVPEDIALIITHQGGNQGKALLNKLTPLAADEINCAAYKPYQLAKFVAQEVQAGGKAIGADAAQALVDAVGHDTRALAAAVTQLLADTDDDLLTVAIINRHFAGRATVNAFAVADDALAGRVGEAIVKLRWALTTGVAHVLVTSALANSLRQIGMYLAISRHHPPGAAEIGVPTWKIKDIATSARAWSEPGIADAIRAVAQADAQIKGAAQDPDFALESLIIRLGALRRSAKASPDSS
ncbi:MAG: DNA polymerase III subunit delta [Propionibacteriaceae bacterium]|nr:DNA polymerase III subunit delta [Propionibacteriaceae bacterium]